MRVKRMKNKGFTLVELLVVMVILGIITAMAIPLVRNIRQDSSEKEYATYQESVRYAAKLYVDSYGEDLFGYEESGCAIILYDELKAKNLIKDIDLKNISCETEDTFARVVKLEGKYHYTISLGCGKKGEDGVSVTYRLPKNETISKETCSSEANTIMTISHNVTDPNSIKYKEREISVVVSSNTGIRPEPIIHYGFSNIKSTDNIIWNILSIEPESEASQRSQIERGHAITTTSTPVKTPQGLTGPYYLVLRIDRLQDISKKTWSSEETGNYLYLGPFTLDNEAPIFNDSTVISTELEFNSLQPQLFLTATDNYSNSDNLRMCISYDTDTCSKNENDIKKKENGYIDYDPKKKLQSLSNTYDGSSHIIYITIGDAAGNYAMSSYPYSLSNLHTPFNFTYTGAMKVVDGTTVTEFGEGENVVAITNSDWYVEFLTSGTLNINMLSSNIDIFAVGGGGGGAGTHTTRKGGAGGEGGIAETKLNWKPNYHTNYTITIGAGGAGGVIGNHAGSDGEATTFKEGDTVIHSASGGRGAKASGEKTGNGGATAKDGGNGVYPFNDSSFNKRYGAGGGGGQTIDCSYGSNDWCTGTGGPGNGGANGGGNAKSGKTGGKGAANSGGGGGAGSPGAARTNAGNRRRAGGDGGSGIVIIRNSH